MATLPDLSAFTGLVSSDPKLADLLALLNQHYGARVLDFEQAAELISDNFFEISPRSLERWADMPVIVVNRRRRARPIDVVLAACRRIAVAEQRAAIQFRGTSRERQAA
jgi:hypothetical protein